MRWEKRGKESADENQECAAKIVASSLTATIATANPKESLKIPHARTCVFLLGAQIEN